MEVISNIVKGATLLACGYVIGVTRTCKEYEKNPIEIYTADKKIISDSIGNSVESVKEKFKTINV